MQRRVGGSEKGEGEGKREKKKKYQESPGRMCDEIGPELAL